MFHLLRRFCLQIHFRIWCILRQLCNITVIEWLIFFISHLFYNNSDHWIMKIEIQIKLNLLQLMHASKCNIKSQKTTKTINETYNLSKSICGHYKLLYIRHVLQIKYLSAPLPNLFYLPNFGAETHFLGMTIKQRRWWSCKLWSPRPHHHHWLKSKPFFPINAGE